MPMILAQADEAELSMEDAERLVRRVLTELGLDPAALTIAAADFARGLVHAHTLGVRVGFNEGRTRRCKICGCTELTACRDVCAWVEPDPFGEDVCTSCDDPSGLAPAPAPALICEAS